MKIIFKIIAVNLIILICLFLCIEYYTGHKYFRLNFNNLNVYPKVLFHSVPADKYFKDLYYGRKFAEYAFSPSFRPDENMNSRLKPVLLMGCSFTYGDGLDENETMSYKLGKLTGRPIYNRAGKGFGPSHFLYQLKNENFYKLHREPEYIIYLFISNHENRIYKFKIEPLAVEFQPRYKYHNGTLEEIKPKFTDRFITTEAYQYFRQAPLNVTEELTAYFSEAQKEIKKHWKDAKLTVLLMPSAKGADCEHDQKKLADMEEALKNTGIRAVNLEKLVNNDFSDEKFKADGYHPSAYAWDVILPELIKELKLRDM